MTAPGDFRQFLNEQANTLTRLIIYKQIVDINFTISLSPDENLLINFNYGEEDLINELYHSEEFLKINPDGRATHIIASLMGIISLYNHRDNCHTNVKLTGYILDGMPTMSLHSWVMIP